MGNLIYCPHCLYFMECKVYETFFPRFCPEQSKAMERLNVLSTKPLEKTSD